jgi:hypothetical protein
VSPWLLTHDSCSAASCLGLLQVLHNNLGGMGPDSSDSPPSMRFVNVGTIFHPTAGAIYFDVELTNQSSYTPDDTSLNGLLNGKIPWLTHSARPPHRNRCTLPTDGAALSESATGKFAQVNLACDHSVDLRATLKRSCALAPSCRACTELGLLSSARPQLHTQSTPLHHTVHSSPPHSPLLSTHSPLLSTAPHTVTPLHCSTQSTPLHSSTHSPRVSTALSEAGVPGKRLHPALQVLQVFPRLADGPLHCVYCRCAHRMLRRWVRMLRHDRVQRVRMHAPRRSCGSACELLVCGGARCDHVAPLHARIVDGVRGAWRRDDLCLLHRTLSITPSNSLPHFTSSISHPLDHPPHSVSHRLFHTSRAQLDSDASGEYHEHLTVRTPRPPQGPQSPLHSCSLSSPWRVHRVCGTGACVRILSNAAACCVGQ